MTYSRPQIRSLDALQITPGRIAEAESTAANDRIRPQVSREGDYLDNRSPSRLAEKGRAQNEEAQRRDREGAVFLESLLGVGEKLYKGWETGEINRQVSTFLSDPANLDNLSEGDRSLLRGNLRGANEQIDDAVAKRQTQGRQNLYQQLVTSSPIFSGDSLIGMSPEKQAEALAKERLRIDTALDETYPITGLSTRALSKFAPDEIRTRAGVDANAIGSRRKAESNSLGAAFSQTVFLTGVESVNRTRANNAQALSDPSQLASLVDPVGAEKIQGLAEAQLSSFRFNRAEVSRNLFNGYQQTKAELLRNFSVSRNPDELVALLSVNVTIGEAAGQAGLLDEPINEEGVTLGMLLSQEAVTLRPQIEAAQERRLLASQASRWANEDYEIPPAELDAMIRANPEKAIDIITQNRTMDRQPTEAEVDAATRAQAAILSTPDSQFDAQDWYSRIARLPITPEQKASLVSLVAGKGDGPRLAPEVQETIQFLLPSINGLASQLLEGRDGKKGANGLVDPNLVKAETDTITGEVFTRLTEWKLQRDRAKQSPTLDEYRQEAARILAEIAEKRAAKSGAAAPLDSVTRARREFETYLDWQKKKPNSLEAIPQRVKEKLRKDGVPVTFENGRKQLLEDLTDVVGPDGKKPFENIREEEQRRIQTIKREREGGGPSAIPGTTGPQSPYPRTTAPPTTDSPIDKVRQIGAGGLNLLSSAVTTLMGGSAAAAEGPGPAKPKGAKKAPAPSTPSDQGAVASIAVLADPAGSRSPALAAGGSVINSGMSNLQRLNQLFGLSNTAEPTAIRPVSNLRATEPALPQVDPGAVASRIPLVMSRNNPFVLAIGIAEGNLTASGRPTSSYGGHTDPGNGARNVGIFSAQNSGGTPEVANRVWFGKLNQIAPVFDRALRAAGLRPSTQAYNRLMFNLLDLYVQSPAAVTESGGFLSRVAFVARTGATIEAVARARADSFYNPSTGRLDASGFGNNYSRLLQDQRSRAGVYDYRRRL